MTACRNKARGAVVAALAGALTLGAAPVMALAVDGAGLMANDSAGVVRADVTYWSEPEAEYTYTGFGMGPVPKTIEVVNEDYEDVVSMLPANTADRVDGAFYFYYMALDGGTVDPGEVVYLDEKGNEKNVVGTQVRVGGSGEFCMPRNAGKYAVLVGQWHKGNGMGTWTYVRTADTFDIVGQPLDSATLCDGLDATDTEFNYTGVNGSTTVEKILERVNVSLDGYILDKGEDGLVRLELWEKGGDEALKGDIEISIGKTYVVKVIGEDGKAFQGQSADKEFTLQRMDLSDAVIDGTVFDVASGEARPTKDTIYQKAVAAINGITTDQTADDHINWNGMDPLDEDNQRTRLHLVFVSSPKDNQTSGKDEGKGEYTFRLVADDDNPNVTGSKEFTVYYADYEADFDFGNGGLEQADGSFVVDLSQKKVDEFDVGDITATFDWQTSSTPATIDEDNIDVTVTDDEGNVVEDMSAPGTYYVQATVDYEFDNDNKEATPDSVVYGTATRKVVVKHAVKEATDVFVSYKNDNVESWDIDTYTGSDLSGNFSVKVMVANGTVLEEGKDYTVSFKRVQADGRVVDTDTIVDAGVYKLVINGVTFTDGAFDFTFFVHPVVIEDVTSDAPYTVKVKDPNSHPWWPTYTEHGAYGYTGDVITPAFSYENADGDSVALDASLYDVQYVRDVDGDGKGERGEFKDLGVYDAHLTTAEGVTNYFVDASLTLEITDTKVFADVPNNEWYSEAVYDAAKLGYMTGYGDTRFFGPADSIKRGDVAVVLYKMAGLYRDDTSTDHPDTGYETPFSDVDMNDYWAEAIQWAARLGIVSGDGGADTFRPNDPVTREELAKMLYRFMELQGKTGEVDADAVLGEYEDESSVSDWARTYVAWLVDQEVMGQNSGLEGNKVISRAEVAAMTVRLQPNGQLNGDEFLL